MKEKLNNHVRLIKNLEVVEVALLVIMVFMLLEVEVVIIIKQIRQVGPTFGVDLEMRIVLV